MRKRYEQLHSFEWPQCHLFMTNFWGSPGWLILGQMMFFPHTICRCCVQWLLSIEQQDEKSPHKIDLVLIQDREDILFSTINHPRHNLFIFYHKYNYFVMFLTTEEFSHKFEQ